MAKDLKMLPEELLDLHALASDVYEHDHLTGRALLAVVHHLAHAHNLDVADEQEKANKKADEQAQAREKALAEESAKIETARAGAAPSQEGKK